MDFRITGIHIDHAAIDRALAPALRAAMEELGTAEQAAIVKSLGVPVGRDANGNVIERSKPGEPPRKEEASLSTHVEHEVSKGATAADPPVLTISAHRPPLEPGDDPEAAVRLEFGGYSGGVNIQPRPFMAPALERLKRSAPAAVASHLARGLKR